MRNKTNNSHIEFTELFNKQRKAAPHEIKIAFREALALFLENSLYPQLRSHPLRGKLSGYRSIDVRDDWRAIFKQTQITKQQVITFHKLGNHQMLYKK